MAGDSQKAAQIKRRDDIIAKHIRGENMKTKIIFAGLLGLAVMLPLALPAMALASPQDDLEKGIAAAKAQDFPEALRLWRKAAELGYAEAQVHLGEMYAKGRDVKQDDREALRWWRKAAEQGNAEAQASLGFMYRQGRGVAQDGREALRWFHKAAEQGYAKAQVSLGLMYADSHGVAQDDREAVRWFHKAAEQGNAGAQTALGFMYRQGRGVAQDYVQAHKWFNIASALGGKNGKKLAKTSRQGVEKKMSAQQIGQAQTEATKWLKAYKKRRR